MKLPTPDQRAAALDSIAAGVPIDRAARAAGTSTDALRAAARDDDDFADALESAEATGGAARTRATAPTQAPRDDTIDVQRITREAAEHAPGMLGFVLWQDVKLVAAGFPAMSEWWTFTLRALYASGKRWLVVRVGRGGGKSTTLTRISSAENVFGERDVPPGQRWMWPFISVSTTDANRRIVEIVAILGAINVPTERVTRGNNPTIELVDMRGNAIGWVALASTIAGVSGPSTTGATIDEEAKLRDRNTNANPSTEILASLLQTFRARAGIRAIRCSSAWTLTGSHAMAVAEGDTLANHVGRVGAPFLDVVLRGLADVAAWESAHGNAPAADRVKAYAQTVTADSANIPTWLANPTISAVASREEVEALPTEAIGGVPRVVYWLRENASVPHGPGDVGGDGFDPFDGLAERNAKLCAVPTDGARVDGRGRSTRALGMGGNWGGGGAM